MNCWYLVLTQTRRESRDHATLNDIFMNNVIVRLSQISEDVIRLFKKVSQMLTYHFKGLAAVKQIAMCTVKRELWGEIKWQR